MNGDTTERYLEQAAAVETYLAQLRHVLKSKQSKISIIWDRKVDSLREPINSNRNTVARLFPDDDPVVALRQELSSLKSSEYIETVTDTRFPNRPAFRVFGRSYSEGDVYIKIRVEMFAQSSSSPSVLVMSFHFALHRFEADRFPLKESENQS